MTTTQRDDFALIPINQLNAQERHERRMGWFVAEVHRQRANRQRMAKCEAMYDQYQYETSVKADIENRGQYAIVFDRIAPQIDWLIGTERRTRIDYRVDPRQTLDPTTMEDAQQKTHLMKWLDDTGDSMYHRSTSFSIAMKAGEAYTEIGADMDNSGETPVFEVPLSWRELVRDSFSMSMDPRRWRYCFRLKVVDLDIASAYFPEGREQLIRVQQDAADLDSMRPWMSTPGSVLDLNALWGANSQSTSELFNAYPTPNLYNARRRVLLVECWSMEPVRIGPNGRPGGLSDPIRLRPHVSVMTEFATLWEGWSPYEHGRFPFVPYWAYTEGATGLCYSPVRRAMDKQDGLNKAMSRAHYEIATNRIVAEEGAFSSSMSAEEVRDEVDDPAGTVILANGGLARFKVDRGFEEAKAHLMLADRYISAIDESSAITREQRGADGAPISGIARQIKETQGSVMSAELFDNLLMSHKWSGEIKLSVMEQYLVNPVAVPVPDERGQHKMLEVNQRQPDGTWKNDITERKARFVISEQPWRATLAQAQFEQLMELLTQIAPVMPQVVTALLDVVFEFADIPNKKAVLERIRAVTGQPGPDNQQSPEQLEQKQRAAEIAQAEFAAKMATLQATVREAQGKGEKLNAEAMLKQLESIYTAAQAAQTVQMNPGVAPMTDEILMSVGFQDKHPDAALADAPGAATPQAPRNPGARMQPTAPMPVDPAAPPLDPLAGHQAGIQTVGPDGQPTTPMEQ